MQLNIRVAGPAGLGINSTAEIIWSIASNLWYEVLTDIEYESRIKWWTNHFDINISDKYKSISKMVDILIVFDHKSIYKYLKDLKEKSFILSNNKWIEKLDKEIISYINEKNITLLWIDIDDKYDNTYFIWLLAKLLQIPLVEIKKEIEKVFSRKWQEVVDKNIKVVEDIINSSIEIKSHIFLKKIWENKKFSYGNKMITLWALDSWLEYYSAYPMTPASTILTEVIKANRCKFLQAEDEIAVINSALGASYTWLRSMVWSSGWWFALMTEALSFAVQAEIPITVVLSQRAGPSTGTPTYHEQWDLPYALSPTFGDYNHIILIPNSVEEAYTMAWKSLSLADKYQSIVILLIDKQLSEAHTNIREDLMPNRIDRWEILDNPPQDYARYKLTDNWVSPRVRVWTKNWDFIATSYEHDEYGATTEDSEMKKKMTEKRFKKLENFYKKENIKWYDIYNEKAKKIIMTMWLNNYVVKKFIALNPEYGLISIRFLKPLDNRLRQDLENREEVIFIENNYSGQLENYITKELSLNFIQGLEIKNLRKYDLLPFYYEDVEEGINNL